MPSRYLNASNAFLYLRLVGSQITKQRLRVPSPRLTSPFSPCRIRSAVMDNQLGDTEIHMLIDEAIPSDAKRPTNISHIVDDKVQATMDAVWEVSISSRWPKRCSD